MESENFLHIETHLQFLGYNTEMETLPNGSRKIYATSEAATNIEIFNLGYSFIIQARYNIEKDYGSDNMFEIITNINDDSLITKWSIYKTENNAAILKMSIFF